MIVFVYGWSINYTAGLWGQFIAMVYLNTQKMNWLSISIGGKMILEIYSKVHRCFRK